ncbi:MAG: FHA domain-containing protein [Cyanobacteria bacterium J007]|nr:MAG: FHA domain-containing protein [Cyanobacteria bacterium J007]
MNSEFGQIQLQWTDPKTGQVRSPYLNPPIAFGRVFSEMPAEINGRRVSRIVLDGDRVSRYHATIVVENNHLLIVDRLSRNGTFINGNPCDRLMLSHGDRLQIGPFEITVSFKNNSPTVVPFHPQTGLPDPAPSPTPTSSNFPPAEFIKAELVSLKFLQKTGNFNPETDEFFYAAVGAGIGSYIFVDYLRICGVRSRHIVAIGNQPKPYGKYQQLCLNSQIPLHERLRSNSDACPDNLWGWPGYALREAWRDLRQGKGDRALRYLWQVFAEPNFAETYTPRAVDLFRSIDREAKRIGWDEIYRYGSVRAIRKTTDGRYAIAYSLGGGHYGYLVAQNVQIATGYPAIRFLEHLQAYRDRTGDLTAVVNAYEDHETIYEKLAQNGGTAIVEGRGIVASRIIQRLWEVRQTSGANLQIVHLMRSPVADGHQFGWSRRPVKHHCELQPFNWPKACWGGDLREMLEKANPKERLALLQTWGGTTTADRQDWQQIIETGLRQGWYEMTFATVSEVRQKPDRRLHVTLQTAQGDRELDANFIIDATGLEADLSSSPFLNDLVTRYQLPRLDNGRLAVSNDFEISPMYNNPGRMYAAGAITLGGPYAAVDSFLGLQYAALRTIHSLRSCEAPQIKALSGWRSLSQWLKWAVGRSPG